MNSSGQGTWDKATSPNVCLKKRCRGPIERFDGDVTFFDGSEAHCIECGALYFACVSEDGGLWFRKQG